MNTSFKTVPSITAATISPIAIIILYCVFVNKGTIVTPMVGRASIIVTPMVGRASIMEVMSNPLTARIQGCSIRIKK